MSLYEDLIQKLYHGHRPYDGFNPTPHAGVWYNDGGARRDIFLRAINEIKPQLIVEVGSFVGESTIFMAQHLKQVVPGACILCVDTWMGGFDHWTKVPEKLRFSHGRPTLYAQFLANVLQHGCQDVILPLTLDSLNGARLIKYLQLVPQLVYVDASHEQGDVRRDYEAYWDLLPTGGGLLVDDLTNHFPGVLRDFKEFVEAHHLIAKVEGEKGLMIK